MAGVAGRGLDLKLRVGRVWVACLGGGGGDRLVLGERRRLIVLSRGEGRILRSGRGCGCRSVVRSQDERLGNRLRGLEVVWAGDCCRRWGMALLSLTLEVAQRGAGCPLGRVWFDLVCWIEKEAPATTNA